MLRPPPRPRSTTVSSAASSIALAKEDPRSPTRPRSGSLFPPSALPCSTTPYFTLPISLFTLHRLPRFPARVALRASLRSVYLGSPLASVHHSPFDSASLPPPGNLRLSVLLRSAHSSPFTFHSFSPSPRFIHHPSSIIHHPSSLPLTTPHPGISALADGQCVESSPARAWRCGHRLPGS